VYKIFKDYIKCKCFCAAILYCQLAGDQTSLKG